MDDIEIEFETEADLPLILGYVDEEGDFNVQIDTDQLGSVDNAGLILAAIEQHLAGALAHMGAADTKDAALAAVRAVYQAELAAQTNETSGGML